MDALYKHGFRCGSVFHMCMHLDIFRIGTFFYLLLLFIIVTFIIYYYHFIYLVRHLNYVITLEGSIEL